MSSRRVEDKHKMALEHLLSAGGMVCQRSPSPSLITYIESVKTEEPAYTVEETESSQEFTSFEESPYEDIQEFMEEEKAIFPSPSLRRLLPDDIRKIEEHNRIHVLPKEFKTKIDPALIPKITPQIKYIDIIAALVGCTEYRTSMAEFWFLDTMANLLRRAQEDQLPRTTQAVLMLWFCEWMKEIQNFDAADRRRMLRRFKDNMLSAARCIAESSRLPTPLEAGVFYKAVDEEIGQEQPKEPGDISRKESSISKPTEPAKKDTKSTTQSHVTVSGDSHIVSFQDCAYECAMKDLVTIMHYIFDLFSIDYQFDLVRSIFTFTPEYRLIEMPYTLQNPKRIFAPYKPKKEKAPKKEKGKETKKGKKKEPDTEEYIALMEFKAKDEREFGEQELKDAEQWNLRNSILPLGLAGTDELFDKYWPPPPPEPEPEPEPVPVKGKKKK